ncbi:MAG: LCP family protein [Chloroflexaceae bacterium]|nr:LCP family protein [Chloroflexaceae bacterium]
MSLKGRKREKQPAEGRPLYEGGEAYTDRTVALPRRETPGQPAVPGRRGAFWERVRLALLLGVAALLAVAGLFYWQVHSLARAITVRDVRNNPPIATPLLGANMLIIGVDERPGHPEEGVRGDTLLLARLDAGSGWVSLLSIPRDAQVEVEGVGVTKINVAYGQGHAQAAERYGPDVTPQEGGMALAAATVEEFLDLRQRGMRVDFITTVNFAGFEGIIDALGGVTIDVPRYILDEEYPTEDFGTMRVEFQPGPQRMDGKTALIYARTRHADSDFGRAQRQQQVVRAVLEELRARGWVGRALALPGLLRAIAGQEGATAPVATTLPVDRLDTLLGLMSLAGRLDPETLGQFQLGPEQIQYENGSNLVFEPAAVQAVLDQWQRPPSEAAERAAVQVFNGTDVPGLARSVSLDLERAGFRVLAPDNAPFTVERTVVYNPTNHPATSRRVARTLGAELVHGPPPAGLTSAAQVVVILGADAAEGAR